MSQAKDKSFPALVQSANLIVDIKIHKLFREKVFNRYSLLDGFYILHSPTLSSFNTNVKILSKVEYILSYTVYGL